MVHHKSVPALLASLLCAAACGDDATSQPPDVRSDDPGIPPPGVVALPPDAGPADAGAPDAGAPDAGVPMLEFEARLIIEHNAADDDTGFQFFFDWDPWATISVSGPDGEVLAVEARGVMASYGLTEMFFETNEPPADEMPREEVLELLPEGEYVFDVLSVDGELLTVTALLTHDIPSMPEILSPAEDAAVDPDAPMMVRWAPVNTSLEGAPLDVVAYQIIVARDLQLASGEGFAKPVVNITVPASMTSMPIPAEYLRPGTPYEIEVLAIEASGNQTIGLRSFETSGTTIDEIWEVSDPGPMELSAAKYLIEHNATDQDTGYQIFLDGEPWQSASVMGPASDILAAAPHGSLADFGLTEMFFETNEPPADEMPLEEILALFPEGAYEMSTLTAEDGTTQLGTAALTHDIPQPSSIVMPLEDAEIDASMPLLVSWSPVASALDSSPLDVVAYQVIVEEDVDLPPAAGFFKPVLSIHVLADTTSITVPAAFLDPGAEYEIEVLALESSGNQTIAISTFATD